MTDSTETKRSRRPRHGTVVAYVALFMALATSGAWAAATIGPSDIQDNAIRTRHIQGNAVKTAKIAPGAIKTSRIANGAVTGGKVGTDTLTGDNIDESSLGQVPFAAQADRLGGFPASSFTRVCGSGTVAAHVYVKGLATFSPTYTTSGLQNPFNCTGSTPAVQVKRVAAGTYYVDFPGVDPAGHLVATGNETVDGNGAQDNNVVLTYKLVADAAISRTVYRVETANAAGTLVDREFSFSVDS
jgi:hypothetical protein